MAWTFSECESSIRARGVEPTNNIISFQHQPFASLRDLEAWLEPEIHRKIRPRQHGRMVLARAYHVKDGACASNRSFGDVNGRAQVLEEARENRTVHYHVNLASARMTGLNHLRGQPPQKVQTIIMHLNYHDLSSEIGELQSDEISIDSLTPVHLLPGLAQDILMNKLNEDANDDVQRAVLGSDRHLTLQVVIRAHGTDDRNVKIDHAFNVDTLGDLLADPTDFDERPELGILMSLENDASRAVRQIKNRTRLAEDHDWNIYRIGNFEDSIDAEDGPEDHLVSVTWPLFAWWHTHGDTSVSLYTVPGYNFGNFGLLADHMNSKNFFKVFRHPEHELLGTMAGYEDKDFEQLAWRVKTQHKRLSKRRQPQIGNGPNQLPFLPSYCFNRYDKSKWVDHMGLRAQQWPEGQEIHIAVRAVAHIAMHETGPKDEPMPLPHDIRFTVAHNAVPAGICRKIEAFLRREDERTDYDPDALYDDPGQGQNKGWEMQLWVLPQQPAPLKLWRFDDGGDPESRDLKNFFNANPTDFALYMEAHILPRADDDALEGDRVIVGNVIEVPDQSDEVRGEGHAQGSVAAADADDGTGSHEEQAGGDMAGWADASADEQRRNHRAPGTRSGKRSLGSKRERRRYASPGRESEEEAAAPSRKRGKVTRPIARGDQRSRNPRSDDADDTHPPPPRRTKGRTQAGPRPGSSGRSTRETRTHRPIDYNAASQRKVTPEREGTPRASRKSAPTPGIAGAETLRREQEERERMMEDDENAGLDRDQGGG